MDPSIEIRKLSPSIVRELALILDYADSWKRLMAIIPKKLSCNGYMSNIALENVPKYNSEHFKIIELGGIQFKRSCTEILFDEWGTSGRPRASLGHLKYLLTKAELFRAADYVAKLLGEEPPQRPATGPAAIIPTNLSLLDQEPNPTTAEIERQLDEINYPQVAIEKIRKKSLEVKNVVPVIPEIIVSEVKSTQDSIKIPLVVSKINPRTTSPEASDMIQFSHDDISMPFVEESDTSVVIPELSILLHQGSGTKSESLSTHEDNMSSTEFTPAFSKILSHDSTNNELNKSEEQSEILDEKTESAIKSDLIPALSVLNQEVPMSDSSLIPNFDILQSSIDITIPLSDPNSKSNPSSTKCISPLPNLCFNTDLPHFSYADLEKATMGFSSDIEHGRFLGSGAFGSVYLGTGLLGKSVAVKKIILENTEIVNVEDQVTKQFKNEVEILSKCKHPNLVSLLGYSCDGSTYCLVYEYVSGGSLFDMIEKYPSNLIWKQRLRIALGTARAVAYLHTAFSTPLIHRDVKSANILLDAENNAKLCDFGIVKNLSDQRTDSETALYGTSAYMSPEYYQGDISIKLDTFSFGVVLLELLTSLPPFDLKRQEVDLVTYVEDQCEESIEPLLDRNIGSWEENGVNVAKDLYNLTLKCLDYKRSRPVMVEVVKSLEDIEGKLIDS